MFFHYREKLSEWFILNGTKRETVCDGWRGRRVCTIPWVCVCVREICSTLRLLFCHIPSPLPVWHSVRASPVTFSGSWTLGPFSVTLCCHFWLLQPRQWCTRTVGGKWYTANLKVCLPQSCFSTAPSNRILLHRIPLSALMKTTHKKSVFSDVICTQELRGGLTKLQHLIFAIHWSWCKYVE